MAFEPVRKGVIVEYRGKVGHVYNDQLPRGDRYLFHNQSERCRREPGRRISGKKLKVIGLIQN